MISVKPNGQWTLDTASTNQLQKSDRINSGKRKKVSSTTSAEEAKKQIYLLLQDPNISPSTKKKLRDIHSGIDKHIQNIKTQQTVDRIGKPDYTDTSKTKISKQPIQDQINWSNLNRSIHSMESAGDTNSIDYKKAVSKWEKQTGSSYSPGQAKHEIIDTDKKDSPSDLPISDKAQSKQISRDEHKRALKDWGISNQPKQIKELGGRAQMEADQTLRSKKVESVTNSVKPRLSGEEVAVRNKKFGRDLDEQRRIKQAEQKARAHAASKEVIRVPKQQSQVANTSSQKTQPSASPEELSQIKAMIDHPDTPAEHKASLQELYDSHVKKNLALVD